MSGRGGFSILRKCQIDKNATRTTTQRRRVFGGCFTRTSTNEKVPVWPNGSCHPWRETSIAQNHFSFLFPAYDLISRDRVTSKSLPPATRTAIERPSRLAR